jgi:hypothetical protein
MAFDLNRFEATAFHDRTEAVPVPALAAFFGKKEDPLWTVRGLSHAELAQAEESITRGQDVEAVVTALTGKSKDKAEAITGLLGVTGNEVPRETKKRMELLVLGSVDPEVSLSVAVKLSQAYPIEFGQLTNKILQLTGQGKVQAEVKPKPSGD